MSSRAEFRPGALSQPSMNSKTAGLASLLELGMNPRRAVSLPGHPAHRPDSRPRNRIFSRSAGRRPRCPRIVAAVAIRLPSPVSGRLPRGFERLGPVVRASPGADKIDPPARKFLRVRRMWRWHREALLLKGLLVHETGSTPVFL